MDAGYREWRAAAPVLRCSWAGRIRDDGEPFAAAVLPDGCSDLIWDGGRLFVAGPDTGPVPIEGNPGSFFVGVRFRPAMARPALGVAMSELLDQRVEAADVWGRGLAGVLVARLEGTRSLREAARTLEAAVVDRLGTAPPPDRQVLGALTMIHQPVAEVARELGLSERQLHRRCTAEIGYGLKTLDRVTRFRRFLTLAEQRPGAPLAGLAAEAGYADQPHLTRECQRLAGVSPASLLATSRPSPSRRRRSRPRQ